MNALYSELVQIFCEEKGIFRDSCAHFRSNPSPTSHLVSWHQEDQTIDHFNDMSWSLQKPYFTLAGS